MARPFADAEAVCSYEGTREINALIVGRVSTGKQAFVRPATRPDPRRPEVAPDGAATERLAACPASQDDHPAQDDPSEVAEEPDSGPRGRP